MLCLIWQDNNLVLTLSIVHYSTNLDRTGELRKFGFQTRNLGSIQMTTDTALYVTNKIIKEKGFFSKKLIQCCLYYE